MWAPHDAKPNDGKRMMLGSRTRTPAAGHAAAGEGTAAFGEPLREGARSARTPGLHLAVALLGVCAASCAPAGDRPADAVRPGILDAHLHTTFTGEPYPLSGIPYSEEELRLQMARAGVVGGVAHTDTLGAGTSPPGAAIIRCRGVGAHVDTLVVDAALATAEFGCLKVYLGYAHRRADDPGYDPLYRLAARHRVPVVFHTGDTADPDARLEYAHPLAIDAVAVRHREVSFVIAHAGYPWVETAAEVTYKNPNVYLEGSAFLAGDLREYPEETVETLVVRPLRWIFLYLEDPRKMIFGSDWPVSEIDAYVSAYARAVPREHWQDVFHDNAARVFGLER